MAHFRDSRVSRFSFLLAALILLALLSDWFLAWALSPLFHSPAIDEAVHWAWAQSLALGDGSPEVPYFRAPLYPWLLGGLARLGLGLTGLRLAGVLLILGSLVLLVFWARRLGGPRAARAMAFLALLDAGLLYYAPMLLIPALLVPLTVASGLLLCSLPGARRPAWITTGAGLLLGLAAIARPTALAALLPGAVLVWHLGRERQDRPGRMRPLLLFLGGVILPVALVAGINGWPGSGVLIASQGGVNFWIGNNGQSDGTSAVLPGVGQAWEREDARLQAAARGADTPAAESAYYMKEGLHWLAAHPLEAGALWLHKLSLVFERRPLGNNTAILAMAEQSPSLHWLLQWGWSALLFLGLGGLLEGHPRPRPLRLWLLAVIALEVLGVVAFFVNTRFLLPASALLLVPAACWLGERAGRGPLTHQGQRVLLFAGLGAAALVFTPHPVVPGLLAGGLAGYLPAPAEEVSRRSRWYGPGLALALLLATLFTGPAQPWLWALVCLPGWLRLFGPPGDLAHPRLLILLALALALTDFNPWGSRRGADSRETEQSRRHFQEGNAWLRLQQPDSAQASFLASLKAWPGQPEVRLNLGLLAEARQQPAEAERWYREELEHDPSSAKAHNNLGNLALRTGRTDQAITAYETALRLRPGLGDASWNLGLARSRAALEQLDHGDTLAARTLLDQARKTDYTGPTLETLQARLK